MPKKKTYRYSTGETFEADMEDLKRLLRENQEYLDNYLDLYGSLDDDEYVARRLMENMTSSGRGKLALRQKLRQKGISEEIEQSVMEDVSSEDQDAACLEAARKLFRKYASLEPREQKQKLSRALASRGFGWDSVSYAIEKLIRESED